MNCNKIKNWNQKLIVDLTYFKQKFAKFPQATKLLKEIGFVQGSNSTTYVFPYDQTFPKMMIAKEFLASRVVKRQEENSYFNIESKLTFPNFQKYSDLFGVTLLPKNARDLRARLKISIEEVQFIHDRCGAQCLEQFAIQYGVNTVEFSMIVSKVFMNQGKAQEFLGILKELWLECNAIRRAAVFVRQTFSDRVSKADLCENLSENSKLARNLIPLDMMQAKGLRKNTGGRLSKIEDAVYMMIEREAFKQQGLLGEVENIDLMIFRGLLARDKVQRFWQSIQELMLERISRLPGKKRAFVKEEDVLTYCKLEDPKIDIDNLSDDTKIRIENLDELIDLRTRMKVDRSKGKQLEEEYNIKVQSAIWDPRTWFYQKQLIDDFVLFTMVNNLCIDNNIQMAFNLRQVFRNFILDSNLPTVDLNKGLQKEQDTQMLTEGRDKPLSILKQYETKEINKQQMEKIFGSIFKDEEFIEMGANINTQDFQGWTPLHCAAFLGDIKISKLLLKNAASLDIKDSEGRIPIEVAIMNAHIQDDNSVSALLLKHNSPLSLDHWQQLLIFSMDKDIEIYPKLAYERGIYLHNQDNDTKFSFHNCVCCGAKKVIKLLGDIFGPQTMRRIGLTPDSRNMTALDYAKISDDKELEQIVSEVIGEYILRDQPKSLKEIQEESKLNGLNYLIQDPLKESSIDRMFVSLKQKELDIMNKKHSNVIPLSQQSNDPNSSPALIRNTILPQEYIDEHRSLKIQREIDSHQKYMEQEIEISKRQQVQQKQDFENSLKRFQVEMDSKHKSELDVARKVMFKKEQEVDQLKSMIDIQQNQLLSLQRQFEELKQIKEKKAIYENNKDHNLGTAVQNTQQSQPSIESSEILGGYNKNFGYGLDAQNAKMINNNGKIDRAYESVKTNIQDVQSQMRETQTKMELVEREREALKQKSSRACLIF
eukprot:403340479